MWGVTCTHPVPPPAEQRPPISPISPRREPPAAALLFSPRAACRHAARGTVANRPTCENAVSVSAGAPARKNPAEMFSAWRAPWEQDSSLEASVTRGQWRKAGARGVSSKPPAWRTHKPIAGGRERSAAHVFQTAGLWQVAGADPPTPVTLVGGSLALCTRQTPRLASGPQGGCTHQRSCEVRGECR